MTVVGYGHQGRAQALCLRDSGVHVVVGARAGGAGERAARADGFESLEPARAVLGADYVACLLPDEILPRYFEEHLAAALPRGAAVVLAHGFAAVYGGLAAPAERDFLLVSPGAPGVVLRAEFEAGRGVPYYLAVLADRSGEAWARCHAYAEALGSGRPGGAVVETTAREETEVDLFGEQAVVVGGMLELVQAAFTTLVEAGYDERLAYLECIHQLKHLVDVVHEVGPDGLRDRISGTALYGALTRGPRVVNALSRAALSNLLEEIRGGAFAAEWRAEAAAGRPRLKALLARAREQGLGRARELALGPRPGRPAGTTR